MTLGERIKARRKELRLTLREMGEKVDLSASYLCDLERGRRSIGADSLMRLSGVLGIPMDVLMGNGCADGPTHGPMVDLPPSLVRFGATTDMPFRHALACYWMMRTIMEHRAPARRADLDSVDWARFYGAVREFL